MNHYYAKVSARVRCGYCDERVLVTCAEEIDASDEHVRDFGEQLLDEISDQMWADGWGYTYQYCPSCMTNHAKAIAAMETADDYELEETP
jgi:hypothetical protein